VFRAALVLITLLVLTPILGTIVVISAMLRIPHRPGGVYETMARIWSSSVNRAAGMKIRLHGRENMSEESRVYVSNHVSWFDVFALASILKHYSFVAKAELENIIFFGRAARAFGIVFIKRTNRKAAFEAYEEAATQVQGGMSVVVYPEGTRGFDYHLRPFKKGPFVLAISAGVPIVPTIVMGTIEIMGKGKPWIRPGTIDIHFLEPIPTAGYTYDQRDELMQKVWNRMADAMQELYGVGTKEHAIAKEGNTAKLPTSFL
jgi:1-acyl-sn-glycerol-3-phosphate acyltransferase